MRFLRPHSIEEVRGNQFEAKSYHFWAMKEVRYENILTVESEPPPVRDLFTTEKLEIYTLDHIDKINELKG